MTVCCVDQKFNNGLFYADDYAVKSLLLSIFRGMPYICFIIFEISVFETNSEWRRRANNKILFARWRCWHTRLCSVFEPRMIWMSKVYLQMIKKLKSGNSYAVFQCITCQSQYT